MTASECQVYGLHNPTETSPAFLLLLFTAQRGDNHLYVQALDFDGTVARFDPLESEPPHQIAQEYKTSRLGEEQRRRALPKYGSVTSEPVRYGYRKRRRSSIFIRWIVLTRTCPRYLVTLLLSCTEIGKSNALRSGSLDGRT